MGQAGKVTEEFGTAFRRLPGCQECVATTNGTSALRVALRAVDVEAGDEVILPPYTFRPPPHRHGRRHTPVGR